MSFRKFLTVCRFHRRQAVSTSDALLVALVLIVALIVVLILSYSGPSVTGTSTSTSQSASVVWYCGNGVTSLSNSQVNASIAPYDDQVFFNFGGNYTSLAFNVTAVQYTDNYGYGPGYFLNGLSDKLHWYQIGIAYDWPNGLSPYPGFEFMYQEWNSTDYPILGWSSVHSNKFYSVQQNDSILLKLNFTENTIVAYAMDWNTNASLTVTFPSLNATTFIPYYAYNDTSFTTSVLAEWYHVNPYQCDRPSNTFASQTSRITNSSISINEWNFTGLPLDDWSTLNATSTFFTWSTYISNQSTSFRNLSYAVVNASNNANEFIAY